MTLGVSGYRAPAQCDRLLGMLLMPFQVEVQDDDITHRAA